MRDRLKTGFSDRLEAQAEARKAMLEKFKPKPMVQAEVLVTREARKAAELEAVRKARADAKEAARLAAEEAKAAQQQAVVEKELSELDKQRAERKERKAAAKAEARARREAKKR